MRSARLTFDGVRESMLLLVFGLVLSVMGEAEASSAAPVVAYIVLAELLVAWYFQEGDTIVRDGVVFTIGVALGLIYAADWFGLVVSVAAYAAVTAFRFRRSAEAALR
jgi:hypothetical protein